MRLLLSLDRDNGRLLTALVEICGDWFLDLYDTENVERLRGIDFCRVASSLAELRAALEVRLRELSLTWKESSS